MPTDMPPVVIGDLGVLINLLKKNATLTTCCCQQSARWRWTFTYWSTQKSMTE